MKKMKKGRLFVRQMKLSRIRYDEVRGELFARYGKHKTMYVPYAEEHEAIIVRSFIREGKWPSAPVERYISGNDVLSLFKFNGSYLVTEKVGKIYVVNCLRNIDTWFRFSLLRSMMVVSPDLAPLMKDIRRIDELVIIGDLWKAHLDSGTHMEFSEWVTVQKPFMTIMNFRKNHIHK